MVKRAIGIRAEPSKITYAILSQRGEDISVKTVDKIVVPIALNKPDQLKFIRTTILDILDENKVSVACIRKAEGLAQNPSFDRIEIEAVIQESIASSSVNKYIMGVIASISAKIGMNREQFEEKIKSDEHELIEEWKGFKALEKESILSALAALKI